MTDANPFAAPDGLARSLNRAAIAWRPAGLQVAGIEGKRAYDLLSAEALRELILPASGALGLDPADPHLLPAFDRCLNQPATREQASTIARAYGERLGCLMAMLKEGAPANRAARPEWTAAHWTWWAGVRRVIAGGGMMSGQAGAVAVEAANETLRRAGIADLTVERSPFGRWLPLVGLARAAPPGCDRALLFDFGQSSAKRGIGFYRGGELMRLELLEPAGSPCDAFRGVTAADVQGRWELMRDLIARTWQETIGPSAASDAAIILCLASHMHDGHPLPTDTGCYGSLQRLGPHLETFMRDELEAALGVPVGVTLMHDGAAAAAACAKSPDTVALVLGTAIGVGYGPRLRVDDAPSIADGFRIEFRDATPR